MRADVRSRSPCLSSACGRSCRGCCRARIARMKNPAVDAYIAKSADFAQPILRHLRALMHKGCPRRSRRRSSGACPTFEREGIVAMMAAFKGHVAFGFWSEKLIREKLGRDAARLFPKGAALGMGGRRYLTRAELPPDAAILRAVEVAVALNESASVRCACAKKKAAAQGAALPRGRTEEEREGARDVRAAHAGQAARVRRVAGRSEAGGDARAAPRAGHRVARRRQAALLEIPGLLIE